MLIEHRGERPGIKAPVKRPDQLAFAAEQIRGVPGGRIKSSRPTPLVILGHKERRTEFLRKGSKFYFDDRPRMRERATREHDNDRHPGLAMTAVKQCLAQQRQRLPWIRALKMNQGSCSGVWRRHGSGSHVDVRHDRLLKDGFGPWVWSPDRRQQHRIPPGWNDRDPTGLLNLTQRAS